MRYALRSRIVARVAGLWLAGGVGAVAPASNGAGIVGLTWPADEAYSYLYTPGGVPTTLCLGLAVTAANGTAVSLQPCGTSARELWIACPRTESAASSR